MSVSVQKLSIIASICPAEHVEEQGIISLFIYKPFSKIRYYIIVFSSFSLIKLLYSKTNCCSIVRSCHSSISFLLFMKLISIQYASSSRFPFNESNFLNRSIFISDAFIINLFEKIKKLNEAKKLGCLFCISLFYLFSSIFISL